VETIRQYLFWVLRQTVTKSGAELTFDHIDRIDLDGQSIYQTVISAGKESWTLDWAYESGNWRIIGAEIPEIFMSSVKGDKARADAKEAAAAKLAAKAAEEAKPKPRPVPTGFSIYGGVTALPMLSGWTPGVDLGIGANFGIGPVLGIGTYVRLYKTSNLISANYSDFQSDLLKLCFELALKLGYFIPSGSEGGIYPYLGVNGIIGAEPSIVIDRLFFDLAVGPGLLFQLGRQFSIGIEGQVVFSTDIAPWRMSSFPLHVFLVF
jgi:hypothetical protein